MIDFTIETEIKRPVAEVFAYVTDPAKLATWQTNTVSAVAEDGAPVHVGTRLREVHRGPGGRQLSSLVEVSELVPDRLFAAFNLIYTPEIEREFGSPDWKRASTLGVLGALTYRIMPKVALGAELEYYRAHEGLGLNTLAGDALYVGPTFHMQVTNKFILAAAFSTQIAGHASGNANFLDLTNFSRNKAFLRAVFEF